jgi:hypothetical protein
MILNLLISAVRIYYVYLFTNMGYAIAARLRLKQLAQSSHHCIDLTSKFSHPSPL